MRSGGRSLALPAFEEHFIKNSIRTPGLRRCVSEQTLVLGQEWNVFWFVAEVMIGF